jgi:hypothetical protein
MNRSTALVADLGSATIVIVVNRDHLLVGCRVELYCGQYYAHTL